MNSWNQTQNQHNMVVGQAQFSPYNNYLNFNRTVPIYRADPIHGENAAWQYPMGPGSEIWLPDAEQDIIWWIQVDNNGNRSVKSFDIKPHEEPEPVDMNSILERLTILEEKVNAKQNKSNAKRTSAVVEPTIVSD